MPSVGKDDNKPPQWKIISTIIQRDEDLDVSSEGSASGVRILVVFLGIIV